MMRLSEDRLLAERLQPHHVPDPHEPARDVTLRPSPEFAALTDPLGYGWDSYRRHTAQDTTEMPCVERAEAAPAPRRRAIRPLLILCLAVCCGAAYGVLLAVAYGAGA